MHGAVARRRHAVQDGGKQKSRQWLLQQLLHSRGPHVRGAPAGHQSKTQQLSSPACAAAQHAQHTHSASLSRHLLNLVVDLPVKHKQCHACGRAERRVHRTGVRGSQGPSLKGSRSWGKLRSVGSSACSAAHLRRWFACLRARCSAKCRCSCLQVSKSKCGLHGWSARHALSAPAQQQHCPVHLGRPAVLRGCYACSCTSTCINRRRLPGRQRTCSCKVHCHRVGIAARQHVFNVQMVICSKARWRMPTVLRQDAACQLFHPPSSNRKMQDAAPQSSKAGCAQVYARSSALACGALGPPG